jgi:multidrug transporter EmrE-like cation transporter
VSLKRPRLSGWLGWALFISAQTGVQIAFKRGGASLVEDQGLAALALSAVSSPWVLAGGALYLVGFVMWISILQHAELGRAFPMTALTYLGTVGAGVVLFGEHVSLVQITAIGLILAGVGLLAAEPHEQ